MSSPEHQRGRWLSVPTLVPFTSTEPAGGNISQPGETIVTQEVPSLQSSSMSSPELASEQILSSLTTGTAAQSTSRKLSKVDTGRRVHLGEGPGSARLSQQKMGLIVGERNRSPKRDSSGKQAENRERKRGEGGENLDSAPPREQAYSMPISPRRTVVARENEMPVRTYRVEPVNLHSWDGLANLSTKVWNQFVDWNSRRPLKEIKASLHVLCTYHDACLYGEVPLHVRAKSRLRAGLIGLLWHII